MTNQPARMADSFDRRNLVSLVAVFVVAWAMMPGQASSHREAPLTAQDPMADNTDVYAWRNADEPDKVTLIANFIPFQKPDGGPNFYSFDPNVVYEIHVDNNGDAVEDITFQWRFTTEIRNPATFLYNTGAVTSLDDPDLNVRQFYRLTRIDGPRRTGTVTRALGPSAGAAAEHRSALDAELRLPWPAAFSNSRATSASSPGSATKASTSTSAVFDLLGVGSGQVEDSTAGFNVSSLAIQMPIIGADAQRHAADERERSQRGHRRVVDGEPLCHADADRGRADAHRCARAGVAARQSARQRGGDRSRAQGRVQRHRADQRCRGARSRDRSGSAEASQRRSSAWTRRPRRATTS